MVQQLTGEIERIVADLVDKVAQQGSETVDLVEEVAIPLPLSVISTMLGVGDAERDRVPCPDGTVRRPSGQRLGR